MKEIKLEDITKAVARLCIDAACNLSGDIYNALTNAEKYETSLTGREVLKSLLLNADIAREKQIPICQDTGMAVVFVELGQEVYIKGGTLTDAINKGVSEGYTKGCLRASVVKSPFDRVNTEDNTPAIIHYDIVSGDKLKITVCPKGAGSENKSRIKMLAPADGMEAVKEFIIETVRLADASSCPPMIIGVGIGGNMEECALTAKKALLRNINERNNDEKIALFEDELLNEMNSLGIGPSGMGGKTTALKVNIIEMPTHIAQLPVAVNISCHAMRHAEIIL